MTLIGTYETAHASKYLVQLCKHFAHKIDVTYSETHGTAQFVLGQADFEATADTLTVQFELSSEDQAEMAKSVIDKHLERFAHRENFSHMAWHLT